MGAIKIEIKNDSKNDTAKWIKKVKNNKYQNILKQYGDKGVKALSDVTPVDSGKTASSWSYEIIKDSKNRYRLIFSNSNIVNEWANVAILIQYGHATKNGGWIEGRDYINPAIQPIFDSLVENINKTLRS